MSEIIVIVSLFLLLVETLYLLFVRVSKNKCEEVKRTKMPDNVLESERTEIDITREKKEVKKKAIQAWRKEHEKSRKYFIEKNRNERKDKGKRRNVSGSGLDDIIP